MTLQRPLAADPAPHHSSLVVRVPCRQSGAIRNPVLKHTITIHPDWSVSTPHDSPSERIAVALGGRSSCTGLIDRGIPALRQWIGLMLRRQELPLCSIANSQWTLTQEASCCAKTVFAGAVEAAIHARSIGHLASLFDADWDLVTTLAAAASHAYGSEFELTDRSGSVWRASAACMGGIRDVTYLWHCGLTPEGVIDIHQRAQVNRPLGRAFYTGVIARCIDPEDLLCGDAPAASPEDGAFDPSQAWSTYLTKPTNQGRSE